MSTLQKLKNALYSFTHTKQWIDYRARISGKKIADIIKTYYGGEDRRVLVNQNIFIKSDNMVIRNLKLSPISQKDYESSDRHDISFQVIGMDSYKPINECSFEEYLENYWPYIKQMRSYE